MPLKQFSLHALSLLLEKYSDYTILVEGKKDVAALHALGFLKVYALHQTSVPLRIRVENIVSQINKKEKVCILTDNDKEGNLLFCKIKPILQELGVSLDQRLRNIFFKAGISHIEGIFSFIEKTKEFK